ncbi:type II secretion system protein GspD [Chromobacterium vaccinii]|uniref:type II secretion system protein GspD n=1 Tax=Chromobacterium vaccinii TaxID=1108595 RepID=UPI003C716AFC
MNQKLKIISLSFATIIATGCSTIKPISEAVHEPGRELFKEGFDQPVTKANPSSDLSSTTVHDGLPPIQVTRLESNEQLMRQRQWLRRQKVTIIPRTAVPASEILKAFRDQNINIASVLPLDTYMYSGNGVRNVDGEVALQLMLGAMGLDFDIDDNNQIIQVVPMRSKTWNINLNNRSTRFSSATLDSANGSASTSPQSTSAPSSASTSTYLTPGTPQSTATAASSSGSDNGNSISASDNFWSNIKSEIESRLSVMVPSKGAATGMSSPSNQPTTPSIVGGPYGMQQGANGQQAGSDARSDLFTKQKVGTYSVNPDTGAITVQAPSWIMKQLDEYLTELQKKYNTRITFKGVLFNVTTNKQQSEGFDISAFGDWAKSRYGAILQNGILGGINVTFNGNLPNVAIGNATLPGSNSLLGIRSPLDGLQIFNAYLSSIGNAKVIQQPRVVTSHGAPAEFGRKQVRYWTTYTQNVASGGATGSGVVGTNTVDVPYTIGAVLRINPTYDAKSGLIRAQVALDRDILDGFDVKQNIVTFGNSIQTIPSQRPIVTQEVTKNEVLLHDGELILVGGMIEDNDSDTESGITGLKDIPVAGGLFGQIQRSRGKTTTYFALQVKVDQL